MCFARHPRNCEHARVPLCLMRPGSDAASGPPGRMGHPSSLAYHSFAVRPIPRCSSFVAAAGRGFTSLLSSHRQSDCECVSTGANVAQFYFAMPICNLPIRDGPHFNIAQLWRLGAGFVSSWGSLKRVVLATNNDRPKTSLRPSMFHI